MGTIGTFGSFTQARLAIYASHMGLSVTGNNIANINTTGYTRQTLDQESFRTGGADRYHSSYSIRVGNGVLTTGVSQLRDPYLDIRYRSEMSSVGAMDAKLGGLESIQAILDEVGDGDDAFGVLEVQLSDLYNALQQINDQTGHAEYDIQVRSSAEALTKQFNSYAAKLEEVYDNAVTAFKQDVDTVNGILTSIRDLNAAIRKNEIHGDKALELKDERNLLIDQLSEYMKIDVTYEEEDIGAGQTVDKLVIKLANANPDSSVHTDETTLIDGIYARQVEIEQVKNEDNPAYEDDPDNNLPFLDENGNPTTKETHDHPNFNLILSRLENSKGKPMVEENKLKTEELTNITSDEAFEEYVKNNPAGTITNADGTKTTTSYYKKETTGGDPLVTTTKYYKATVTTTYSTDVKLDDNDLFGALQSERELLTESGEFATDETVALDENARTKRGIPYYQNALNLLANQIATAFNEANQNCVYNEKGEYVTGTMDEDGVITVTGTVTIEYTDKNNNAASLTLTKDMNYDELPEEVKNNMVDGNGNKLTIKDYVASKEVGGIKLGAPLFSVRGDTDNAVEDDGTPITAANISISDSWGDGPQIVQSFKLPTGMDEIPSTDGDNIVSNMITLFTTKMDYTPSDVVDDAPDSSMFNGTFQEMWVNIGSVLGNDMKVTTTMLDTYYASSVDLDTSRMSVSSVDLNDEAMNLMQYSQSYNAACRLMTTIDSVLDKLINGTGVTL